MTGGLWLEYAVRNRKRYFIRYLCCIRSSTAPVTVGQERPTSIFHTPIRGHMLPIGQVLQCGFRAVQI
jgi:hypothetical protein